MATTQRKNRRFNAGFNLIEATIVMGIVGIVMGGVFVAWSAINTNTRVRNAAEQATIIIQQIRSTYANRNDFGADISAVDFASALFNSDLIPQQWNVGGLIRNPFGGLTNVTATNATSTFALDFTGVNRQECIQLVSKLQASSFDQGLTTINGTNVVNNFASLVTISDTICPNNVTNASFTYNLKTN